MGEIAAYLAARATEALARGLDRMTIVVDPGIGFGKTVEHNLEIIAELDKLAALNLPILVGPSRKSFIGKILGLPADQRQEGTDAAVAACVLNGAHIVRVHDVARALRVVRVCDAIKNARRAAE
jgi:dihydropteroate synthase